MALNGWIGSLSRRTKDWSDYTTALIVAAIILAAGALALAAFGARPANEKEARGGFALIGSNQQLGSLSGSSPCMGPCTMKQGNRPESDKRPEHSGRDSPLREEADTDTGSYANQDLIGMMRRRRRAEKKLRQRQEEVASKLDDEQGS